MNADIKMQPIENTHTPKEFKRIWLATISAWAGLFLFFYLYAADLISSVIVLLEMDEGFDIDTFTRINYVLGFFVGILFSGLCKLAPLKKLRLTR